MSDLKPGKYRMTVEVEIDEDGYLLPHDSGEMFMADWWVQNDATFEPVPPPQCAECGWWLTTNPESCPSCGTPTGLGVSGEDRSEPTPAPREGEDPGDDAKVLAAAINYVVSRRHGSASGVQRNLRVTFAKAVRLLDLMETWGVVGPAHGSLARTVLMTAEQAAPLIARFSRPEVVSPEGTS